MLTGLIEHYPAIFRGRLGRFSMGITHKLKHSAFWTNEPVSSWTVAIQIVATYREIQMIYGYRLGFSITYLRHITIVDRVNPFNQLA